MASTFFKLKSLTIKGYKNIDNLTLDFIKNNGLTVLIGKNGSGKSNILEAISSIFAGLFKNRVHKPSFDYLIEYEINGFEVRIELFKSKYSIIVDDSIYSKTEFNKKKQLLLPNNIIACYSGESQRLWKNYYWPYYEDYISNIKKAVIIPDLPMLYINRYNLGISLLTLFFFDFDSFIDIKEFCHSELNIKTIDNISFRYNVKKIKDWNDNSVLQMIKHTNKIDDYSILSADKVTLSLTEFKECLSYMEGRDLFKTLYAATMPKEDKVITDISFDIILNNEEIITVDDLSEGEKKSLLMRVILEVLADENSLLLFDEPDSHIHISRKAELKDVFDKYPNRESIITTHSPTLAIIFEGHIEGLSIDEKGHAIIIDNEKAKLVSSITEGMWNVHEQNMFLSSDKPITLLVEGQTDKMHICAAYKALENNYPNLQFDVFFFSGANNIPQFMVGLKTCEVDFSNRKIIAILDNDQEGRDCCNQTQVKYEKNKKNKYGLYAITLPTEKSATIENLYNQEKYDQAFKNVVSKNAFSGLVSDYAQKMTIQAKIEMSNMVKDFKASDFEEFKPLFDIIQEIKNL